MRITLFILLLVAGCLDLRAQSATYQLSPMDKLSISIAQDPVAGRPVEVSVSPLGDLVVPVSRCCEESITVNVRGKTVEEAETEIKKRLEGEFYEKASVQLRVIDPTRRKGQVLIRGAVRSNLVQLDQGKPKTMWEALTEVGVTEYANLKKVKLDRSDGKGKNSITYHDMDAVNKGDRSKDVELQDGDRITVAEKFWNF